MLLTVTEAHVQFLRDHYISFSEEFGKVPDDWVGRTMKVPENVVLEPFVRFVMRRNLDLFSMGAFSYTVTNQLDAEFSCGRYCSIAGGARAMGVAHPVDRASTSPAFYGPRFRTLARSAFDQDVDFAPFTGSYGPIAAGNDVWIGAHAALKGGITIGDGAVVAAHACVTGDVAPYTIVGGNPARVIRRRFSDALVERFLRARWWQYAFVDLSGLDTTDPERFLDGLDDRIAAGGLAPFEPEPIRLAEALVTTG